MDTKVKKYKLMNNPIYHSEKKQKDSLETRGVLLIFLLELEMSGVVVQQMHQNTKKFLLRNFVVFMRNYLLKINLRLF